MLGATIQKTLAGARQQLVPITDQAQLEAEILLRAILGRPRSFLYAWPDQTVEEMQLAALNKAIQRRLAGEPIAYILGQCEFWSLNLTISPATLIPRPETEGLVQRVLDCFTNDQPIRCVDLGTGSGAIAIALAHERSNWEIVATDYSSAALATAVRNAQQCGQNKITFLQGDWFTPLKEIKETLFDTIVSNPPYIAESEWAEYASGLQFEPREALVSGEDGLDALRKIITTAPFYLRPGGYLIVEHGYAQGESVRERFRMAQFTGIKTYRDFAGHERITLGSAYE